MLAELAFRTAGLGGVKVGQINGMALAERLPQSVAARILESNIAAGLLYKLRYRIKPYECDAGRTQSRSSTGPWSGVSTAIREGRDLRAACRPPIEGSGRSPATSPPAAGRAWRCWATCT